MRIRLLLDTELTQRDVRELQQVIDTQPAAVVQVEDLRVYGARLMGATLVETNEL